MNQNGKVTTAPHKHIKAGVNEGATYQRRAGDFADERPDSRLEQDWDLQSEGSEKKGAIGMKQRESAGQIVGMQRSSPPNQ